MKLNLNIESEGDEEDEQQTTCSVSKNRLSLSTLDSPFRTRQVCEKAVRVQMNERESNRMTTAMMERTETMISFLHPGISQIFSTEPWPQHGGRESVKRCFSLAECTSDREARQTSALRELALV